MESLLSELDVADSDQAQNYALIVPKNHPSLIARGSNSLVFELPPVLIDGNTEHMVGKIFKYAKTSTFDEVPEDELHAIGCNSGLKMSFYGLPMTIHWLNQIEPSLDIPQMEEYHGTFNGKYLYYSVMPDLRKGGLYRVAEVDESLIKKLENGDVLKTQHMDLCARIAQGINDRDLILSPAGHGDHENILPAIQQIFLIQYDKMNIGKLIAGDLNHLTIYEKNHQFGIEPNYLKQPKNISKN